MAAARFWIDAAGKMLAPPPMTSAGTLIPGGRSRQSCVALENISRLAASRSVSSICLRISSRSPGGIWVVAILSSAPAASASARCPLSAAVNAGRPSAVCGAPA
jgi:hypothetical protein